MLYKLLLSIFCLASLSVSDQTARRVLVPLTRDSAALLTCYLPAQPTGCAVVACPGGGYGHLAIDKEGHQWAPFFNRQGITYCVLRYRLPHGDRSLPIGDAEKAILTVRDSARVWHINVHNVGIMGSSAGGHLASTVSTHADDSARPDFTILFYPVITLGKGTNAGTRDNLLGKPADQKLIAEYSNEQHVSKGVTPPAIILLADDDRGVPPVENAIAYYTALHRAGISCTLHIYPSGGHGFGYLESFPYHKEMLQDLEAWLKTTRGTSAK